MHQAIGWTLEVGAGVAVAAVLWLVHRLRQAANHVRDFLAAPAKFHDLVEAVDLAGSRLVSAAFVLEHATEDLARTLRAFEAGRR